MDELAEQSKIIIKTILSFDDNPRSIGFARMCEVFKELTDEGKIDVDMIQQTVESCMSQWVTKATQIGDIDDIDQIKNMFEERSHLLMRVMLHPVRHVENFREMMDEVFAEAWEYINIAYEFERGAREVLKMRGAFS
jgi:hypothetical protein